jgi:hypothetical protein
MWKSMRRLFDNSTHTNCPLSLSIHGIATSFMLRVFMPSWMRACLRVCVCVCVCVCARVRARMHLCMYVCYPLSLCNVRTIFNYKRGEGGCRRKNLHFARYILTFKYKKLKKIMKTQARIVAPRWNLSRIWLIALERLYIGYGHICQYVWRQN